ncbi:hypothetical protein CLOSTMETH_02061 [[Clostridium] methylpentosum DSM 5476]|uniref:Uncharacterized protein n=1 Tax=[Clostridium] methylpentosum DSM 5476 TaxID=537013 RepID=C0EDY2_9FIRM|nr:hypothetical protein CLOSTMETH_02061 [[Clostridium] methylpentosum DSM 5476]
MAQVKKLCTCWSMRIQSVECAASTALSSSAWRSWMAGQHPNSGSRRATTSSLWKAVSSRF